MVVDAFVKGLWVNPFSDSLLRERLMLMTEIREGVSIHTITEEVIRRKKSNEGKTKGDTRSGFEKLSRDRPRQLSSSRIIGMCPMWLKRRTDKEIHHDYHRLHVSYHRK